MVKCRYYGSEQLRKDGIVKGKQRYKCKRTTRENDQRYRWCRLEWYGIMVLKRLECVPNPLIIKWNRNYSKILKELIAKATVAETIKNAPILEMDEFLLCRNKFCCWQKPKQNSRTLSWILQWRKQEICRRIGG